MKTRAVLEAVPVVATLAVALAVAVVAFAAVGGQEPFLQAQAHPRPLRGSDLERALVGSPEPYAGHRRDVDRVACRSEGSGSLRNPWRCALSYRSGRHARLLVRLRADGSYVAQHLEGLGSIVGCCVDLSRTG